ncbi:hypothetical protein M514_23943 [Trichuris suis]|uniref:Reverse transcriptase/retrotransposon-derived protein RNase H-like domain-containing protein n=1 Tax=Trichuris suis TaxID=68888 RepID=A0A085N3A6_9BILA|nr:hypothetical protein M514_23943 [Trichuris suis]
MNTDGFFQQCNLFTNHKKAKRSTRALSTYSGFRPFGILTHAGFRPFGISTVGILTYRDFDFRDFDRHRLRYFPRPVSVRGLQRFLGVINFYRRFLPSATEQQAPLHSAIANLNGTLPVPWTPELEHAFEACKACRAQATLLGHPALTHPTRRQFPAANSFLLKKTIRKAVRVAGLFQRTARRI